MSDEVGKAVLSVEADIDQLDVNLRQGAAAVEQFERTAKTSASNASDSISTIGTAAGDTADRVSVAGQRLLASLERQAIQATEGKTAWLELRAAQLGVSDAAAPMIAQLRAAEVAAAANAASFGNAAMTSSRLAETEDQAGERIRLMVSRSLEQVDAMNAMADSADRAAASVARVGGSSAPSRTASELVPAESAAGSATAGGAAAASVAALLTQLDPVAKKLDALDTIEEQLRSSFKAGIVDAGTYAAALGKIGSQRDAIAKVAESAEKGAGMMGNLGLGTKAATSELIVLGREAANGNFSRLGTSLSILAQDMGLLKYLFTPAAAAILTVGAAVGVAAVAFADYENKVTAANTAIIASGNYAGVTAGALLQMADRLGASTGRTGDAATILTKLVSSSHVSQSALADLGQAALDMSIVTGEGADKTADYFSKIGDGAGKLASDVIDRYGLISEATYERIADLEKQGDEERAQDVLAEALKDAAQKRLADLKGSVNEIQSAWDAARIAAHSAWQGFSEGVSGATGTLTPEQELQSRVDWRNGNLSSTNFGLSLHDAFSGDSNESRIAQLQQQVELAKEHAAQQKLDADAAKEGKVAFDALTKAVTAAETPAQKLHDAQQKIIQDWDALSRTNPNSDFLKSHTLQGLLDATAAAQKHGGGNGQNVINQQLRDLDDQYKAREDALKTSLDHTKSLREQGLISLQADLQQEHDLRAAALSDQLAITQKAEEVAAGKKQLSALQKYQDQEKKIRQAMVDNDQKTADDIAAAYSKQQAAVQAYTQALQVQLQVQQNAVDINVQSVSRGSDQSDLARQVNQIQQQYADKARQLAQQLGKPNGISQEQYDEQLAALQKWQSSAVGIVTNGHEAMLAAEGNWANGANRALEDYEAKAGDVASSTAQAFTDAFSGMEDALVQFVSTGKLNFSNLATGIVADIARIEIRAAESKILGSGGLGSFIAQFLGSAGSSTSSLMGVNSGFEGGLSSGLSSVSSVSPYVFHLAGGGPVYGPGTPTSDSIPAWLSNEEGVLNARGMRALGGASALNQLNAGQPIASWKHFADGGAVSGPDDTALGGAGDVTVNIIGGQQPDEVKKSRTASGGTQVDLIYRQLRGQLMRDAAEGGPLSRVYERTWSLNRMSGK
ncbi:hypothetical protein F3J20_22535 [Paraburkholderia sp. Cy-641]|uniref:phage tail tape measure C-terminal domain-containing protein n=1 Tax=Paraburkholderia sp. Cy-641 TaxID=2608337 RepID=UPI0014234BB3|nr:phage tail tape measure C-terminal domain-containing protein [Paraburkholderia sp. Cy-641]NIF80135.1 hypothetical protein [Paraburkholderia sp. Cy-641]